MRSVSLRASIAALVTLARDGASEAAVHSARDAIAARDELDPATPADHLAVLWFVAEAEHLPVEVMRAYISEEQLMESTLYQSAMARGEAKAYAPSPDRRSRSPLIATLPMRQLFILLTAALLASACTVKSEVACDLVDTSTPVRIHRCSELTSTDATQQQDAEDTCPLLGGTVVDACATTGQIGTCKLTTDISTQTIHFYADGGVTATDAEASCKKLAGTWTGS